jgi:hypothetical protein
MFRLHQISHGSGVLRQLRYGFRRVLGETDPRAWRRSSSVEAGRANNFPVEGLASTVCRGNGFRRQSETFIGIAQVRGLANHHRPGADPFPEVFLGVTLDAPFRGISAVVDEEGGEHFGARQRPRNSAWLPSSM